VERRSVDLSHVEILVLDEADRMFDMGFINDIRRIVALVPRTRQTLLFSATMPDEIKKLAAGVQNHPAHVEVGKRQNPAAGVRQHVYRVQRDAKLDLLLHILGTNEMESVLVFSRTKHGADRIARRLERSGIASSALHSDRSQSQRQRALDGFKRGEFRVLIATDIASRGIDVEGISHVINFDTPAYAEDYIHRIGRTGRASATGDALTFVSGEEEDSLRRIEKFTGQSFKREPYPGFHAPAKTADSRAAQHPAQGGRNSRQISGPGQHDRAVHRSKLDRSFSVTERAGKARPAAGPKEELKVVHRDGAVRHRRRYFR
jgi:ATP-dependent RNA helicase RhlE